MAVVELFSAKTLVFNYLSNLGGERRENQFLWMIICLHMPFCVQTQGNSAVTPDVDMS